MSRYQPSAAEQQMIDALTLAGFHVMRRRSYDALRERVRIAEQRQEAERERREGTERWARRECDEQRRLAARLNAVCYAAAALGVPIQAINDALAKANREQEQDA